jgi:hypothetical protein
MTGERLKLIGWRLLKKGSLVGFASVELPIGLQVLDCPVHVSHGRRWAALPAKPQIDGDGTARRDPATGKIAYSPILRWSTEKVRNLFSDRVVELVVARDPEAFQ